MKKITIYCLPLLCTLAFSPVQSFASEQPDIENITSTNFENITPNRDYLTEGESVPQILNDNYLLISTWQDLVHAINSPTINRMVLQNNITIPHRIDLPTVGRYIHIEGNGYVLDLGVNELSFSDDFSLSRTKLYGEADTLFHVNTSIPSNSHLTDVEISLRAGQTIIEGNSTRVVLNGMNHFSAHPSQNIPVAFKVNYVTILGNTETSEVALFDGTNGTYHPTSVDNFGSLNGYISTNANKPFINNSEVIDAAPHSRTSIKSASDSPIVSYSKTNGVFETPYIYLDETSTTSFENKGPLFTGNVYYQIFSVGNNTIRLSSYSNIVDAPEGVGVVFTGTENIALENLSAGALFKSESVQLTIDNWSPVFYDIGLRAAGRLNTPLAMFYNVEYFAAIHSSNELLMVSSNQELYNFLRNVDGVKNISHLYLNNSIN